MKALRNLLLPETNIQHTSTIFLRMTGAAINISIYICSQTGFHGTHGQDRRQITIHYPWSLQAAENIH